jgi:hypothetical protein
MVVFGFGRGGSQPFIKGAGVQIAVGLIEGAVNDEAAHRQTAQQIETLVRKGP